MRDENSIIQNTTVETSTTITPSPDFVELIDKEVKADEGALLFIEDKLDATKKRPYICMHVFKNKAGVPYNWLVLPITSKDSVGKENLVEVKHDKLGKSISYAKLNNLECISWNEKIEIAAKKFADTYMKTVRDKLGQIFKSKDK